MEMIQPTNGNSLYIMMEMQRYLIMFYSEIEGWPMFPLDLKPKENQKLIKNFGDRFIEELAEAYLDLNSAWQNANSNRPEEAQDNIDAYNKELGDAWHFLLEILIAIGWDEDTLEPLIKNYCQENAVEGLYKYGAPITTLLKVGSLQNNQDQTQFNPRDIGAFRIYPETVVHEMPGNAGARMISARGMEIHQQFLWNITFRIKIAMNYLKNREWTKEERTVNEIKFTEAMLETLMIFIRYMEFIGKTETSIYHTYCQVNQKNITRIKGGY